MFACLHPVHNVGASPIGFSVPPRAQGIQSSWSRRQLEGRRSHDQYVVIIITIIITRGLARSCRGESRHRQIFSVIANGVSNYITGVRTFWFGWLWTHNWAFANMKQARVPPRLSDLGSGSGCLFCKWKLQTRWKGLAVCERPVGGVHGQRRILLHKKKSWYIRTFYCLRRILQKLLFVLVTRTPSCAANFFLYNCPG